MNFHCMSLRSHAWILLVGLVLGTPGVVLGTLEDGGRVGGFPDEVSAIEIPRGEGLPPQPALFHAPEGGGARPMLVVLHSWSADYRQDSHIPLARAALRRGWVYLQPDFQGPNRRPEACGSPRAVLDVLQAVDHARKIARVDPERVLLTGSSGGGHMALLMAGLHPERWAAVSAWVPIADLARWYHECQQAGRRYAREIVSCCGGVPGESPEVDVQYRLRSPLSHLTAARGLPVDIQAGIRDGHDGSVPVRHSLLAFNELAHPRDRFTEEQIEELTVQPRVPDSLGLSGPPEDSGSYGDREPLLRRSSGTARITLFDGGHEQLHAPTLHWLDGQVRPDPLKTWSSWRGPLGTGEAPRARPPQTWGEGQNVRFKTPLPGLGHSSPVIWKDRVFLTTAIARGPELPPVPVTAPGAHDNLDVTRRHAFVVLAVDRGDGKILWEREVIETLPHEGGHRTGSLASGSPVVDERRVLAFFGSRGLHCLTHEGEILWSRDLGTLQTKHAHGEGSSPALHGETVVVTLDHEGPSSVVALDATTGDIRWRQERDEPTSWSSPIVVEHEGRAQVVVNGTGRVRGYDLGTGEVLWSCGGLSANVVATPVHHAGVVYSGSSYDTRALLAIDLGKARGDITESSGVLWRTTRRAPYVPTPLLLDGHLHYLRHYQAILCRVDVRTGLEPTGPFRLSGLRNIYASPVAAGDRIYVTDTEGVTLVLRAGPHPSPRALNRLDDRFSASPALIGHELYLRGHRYLYCLSE